MTREVIVIPPELTLKMAWAIMQRKHIRHLLVLRAGLLVGILSDRDVLLHARPNGSGVDVPDILVGEVMTPSPFVCGPSTPIADVAQTMIDKKIDALPIVSSEDKLVGLVTSTDLMALLLSPKDEARALPFEFHLEEAQPNA